MRALVALGSNLGDRRAHLEAGLALLAELGTVTVSPLWTETPDESATGPDYLNTVALLDTDLDARTLLEALLRAELRQGRDRAGRRNAPRTLDLDLIQAEGAEGRWTWPAPPDLVALGEELVLELPHPRAKARPFVVEPARALGVDV
jgi:2-amino-4-hydroxy-6-hydroxymethyldihydropteridine diphosphokinase